MADGQQPKRVFLSYSHDSEAHADLVLGLAVRLRRNGVDAWLDRYEPHPAEGWPHWMMNQIQAADFVVAVCTDTYCRRFEGREEPGVGRGATWEGLVASQILYEGGTKNGKLIAVRFDESDQVVPRVLRAYQHYRLMDEYEALFRHITNQPEVTPPALGSLWKLTRKESPVPEVPVVGSGLPEPRNVSPFVPGSPIVEPRQFFGRKAALSQVLDAIERRQPVQIVGETRMGKTSLLHQIKRHLPQDLASVWVSAQDQSDEVALVRQAAGVLGRADLKRTLDATRARTLAPGTRVAGRARTPVAGTQAALPGRH